MPGALDKACLGKGADRVKNGRSENGNVRMGDTMNRDSLFHTFFLAILIIALFEFARILEPFATPILGAIVLAILANPLHHRLSRWTPRGSQSFHAAISTLAIFALIVIPSCLLAWLLFSESQSMGPMLRGWAETLRGWR